MKLIAPTNPDIKPGTNVLMIPLDELDLTIRSYHCLHRAGVRRVADLLNYTTPEEIMAIRNFGRKNPPEIAKVLLGLGIIETPWSSFLPKEDQDQSV